jgi:hypothetical protein
LERRRRQAMNFIAFQPGPMVTRVLNPPRPLPL